MLEVKTIKGSFVTEKIAGIESIANKMSENSTTTNAANKEVATVFPFDFTKYFPVLIFQSIVVPLKSVKPAVFTSP